MWGWGLRLGWDGVKSHSLIRFTVLNFSLPQNPYLISKTQMTPSSHPQPKIFLVGVGGIGGVERTYLNPFFDSLSMGFFLASDSIHINFYTQMAGLGIFWVRGGRMGRGWGILILLVGFTVPVLLLVPVPAATAVSLATTTPVSPVSVTASGAMST